MMNEHELLQIINGGESSKVQLKERLPHPDSLAHEIIAFSNSRGGMIIFGVNDKTGALNGLSFGEIQQINQQVVNVASQKIYPPVYLTSDTVSVKGNQIVVIGIEEGISKPYKDLNGTIYLKSGSDKRKITSNSIQNTMLSLIALSKPKLQTSVCSAPMPQYSMARVLSAIS